MTNRVAIISLGCNKNLVDSEIMAGYLKQNGLTFVNDPSVAEVIIVNTCGFIEAAKKEAIDTIFEMAEYKKTGVCKALIVTGCLAKRYAAQLETDLSEADAILGVYNYDEIADVVQKALNGQKTVHTEGKADYLDHAAERILSTNPGTAYLKIAEGCDNHCAYCAIPGIRGNYTSRSIDSLLQEAAYLQKSGVQELILTAQDTTRYGEDRGKNQFLALLHKLSKMDFRWIRILYAYPSCVTEELLDFMDCTPNICKYLDIPIQHTDDEMLAKMNRHYRRADVIRIVEKVRSFKKPWALRTTVICGFPGETSRQFQHLFRFIQQYSFDSLGAFAFSREEGTPADLFPKQCRLSTSEQRVDAIMLRQGELVHALNQKRIGQRCDTLVEGFDEEQKLYYGRTQFLAPEVDGKLYFSANGAYQPGDFVSVQINDAFGYDFFGECKNELSE